MVPPALQPGLSVDRQIVVPLKSGLRQVRLKLPITPFCGNLEYHSFEVADYSAKCFSFHAR